MALASLCAIAAWSEPSFATNGAPAPTVRGASADYGDNKAVFTGQRVITIEVDGVKSVYATDLDGDGDQDVLSASSDDDKIAWYENLGGGAFSGQRAITTESDGAWSVHAADLDGDGDADVLSASRWDGKVAWHENLGNGKFYEQRIITSDAYGVASVHATDLDGDGDHDVLYATGHYRRGWIAWHENRGGDFSARRDITTDVRGVVPVQAVDLDGDGDPDLLYASDRNDQVAWRENLGGGTFSDEQIITTDARATSVRAADLDGDGDADVLSASVNDPTIAWYENLGGGDFSGQAVTIPDAAWPRLVHAGDLDGDGDSDVLAAVSPGLAWHKNLGGGDFSSQRVMHDAYPLRAYSVSSVHYSVHSVHIADLDGDGDRDVLSAYSKWDEEDEEGKVAWYENRGSEFSEQRVITTDADDAVSVRAADLDGDGDPDILSTSRGDDKIAWYENSGDGAYSEQRVITTDADGPRSVHAVDLDGDGDADVLSASWEDDTIAWHENMRKGKFSTQRVITTNADGARSVHAADLDGDGDPDVLSASTEDDKVAWYENLGGRELSAQRVITTDADGAISVHSADLDGDGDADVLSASLLDDKIAWYENLGGGKFSDQRIITTDAHGAWSVHAADLDGDGDADVLSASQYDSKVAWYENLGGGAFSDQRVITYDRFAISVHAADLDGDGDPDVLSASWGGGKTAWFENLGVDASTGYLTFSAQRPTGYRTGGAVSVYTADVDGDGDLDVLSASALDDKIAWYENRIGSPTAAPMHVGVVAGSRRLTVSWNGVPATGQGRSPILRYTAFATPQDGGLSSRCTALATRASCVIEDLAPDVVAYGVRVRAENADGPGPLSAPVSAKPFGSHRLVGESVRDGAGWSVASGAGSQGADTIIGAPFHSSAGRHSAGAVYLVGSADLAVADAADAVFDGVVGLGNAVGRHDSWKLVGESAGDAAGWSVAAVAGHDGEVRTRSYAAIGAPRSGADSGAVYLVAHADLAVADAADGSGDGVVDLGNVAAQAGSWQIVGGAGDRFGASVASAGDVDGDGFAELLIHGAAERRGAGFGAAFVLSLDDADLAAADEADGAADGVIESRRLTALANYWEIYGESLGGRAGAALAAAGDVDGDGQGDLLLGAPRQSPRGAASGAAFLAAGGDLPGGTDGALNAQDLVAPTASYKLLGEAPFDHAGEAVAGAGDASGDGRADLIVGAPRHSGQAAFAGGAAYLIASSSLAAADAADSNVDGTVDLANVAAQAGSWKFVGGKPFEGAGAGLSSAGDLDGDGTADLLVGADAGGAYLLAVGDLPAMDAADGSEDGVVDLRNAAAQANSWRIDGRGQIVGRDLLLSPAGDVDDDGLPDLLLAVGGAVWLLAVSDLPVVLANFDAADGTADGVVDFGILAERIGAPQGGGGALGSVELHQGPLARIWEPRTGGGVVHAPPILGRRGALIARVVHAAPEVPGLSVRVVDANGAVLAEGLRPLVDAETTAPEGAGDRWETAYVLDLPGELHRAGNRTRFEVEGDGEAVIEFDGLNVPRFDIAFVPIRSAAGEPSGIEPNAYMESVLDLLPIAEHHATVGRTLDHRGGEWSVSGAARALLHRWNVEAAGGEFYHGVFVHPGDASACGHAFRGGPVAVSAEPDGVCAAGTVVRGVGGNLSLRPAPGCGAAGADPRFPYPLGGVGPRRGWLFGAGRFVAPGDGFSDFMAGCGPAFVSDYNYRKAAEFLSARTAAAISPERSAVRRSLALTGGVDAFGEWSLDGVSVSRMPPRAAGRGGTHVVTVLDAGGRELHSEPLAVYSASSGGGGGWAARVPLADERVRYVVVRARDGRVVFEERVDAALKPGVRQP